VTNTLQNIIRELKNVYQLELANKHFSNEIILNESLQCSILGDIKFLTLILEISILSEVMWWPVILKIVNSTM